MEDKSLDHIVLAYMLRDKRYAMEVSNSATYEFFDIGVQWLYKIISDHFNNPKFKEVPTAKVVEEYLRKGYTQESFIVSSINTFNTISAIEVAPNEFTWYLDKLKKRYNHKLQAQCVANIQKIEKDGGEDRIEKINEVLRKSVISIDMVERKETFSEGSLDESARDRAREYKEIEANPELARGVFLGVSELDRRSNGLKNGELLIVGGETGTGKSIVLHNFAVNAYLGTHNPLCDAPNPNDIAGGHNILYFSLEMPKKEQERRVAACMAGVPSNYIRDGLLSQEDKEKYFKVLKFQANYAKKFYIVDLPRGATMRELELKYIEKCDFYKIKFDICFVDYLGLMKPSVAQGSDWLELGYVAQEMHEFARTYKIPVCTASQLNRIKDPGRTQGITGTSRIARSSMIPDNANVILQIGCRESEETRIDMPVYIIKMRDGEKGSFTLIKDFAKMKVVDMVDEKINTGEEDYDSIGL